MDDDPILTPTSLTVSVVGETGKHLRLTLRNGIDRIHLWTEGRQIASVSRAGLRRWLMRRGNRRPLLDDHLRLSATELDEVYLEVYPDVAPSLLEKRAVDHLHELAADWPTQ